MMLSSDISAAFTVVFLLQTTTTAALAFNTPHRLRLALQRISYKSTTTTAASSSQSFEWWCATTNRSSSSSAPPARILECIDHITKPWRLDQERIFDKINEEHDRDIQWAKSSPLPFEGEEIIHNNNNNNNSNSIEYESIVDRASNHLMAIRSKTNTPLLSRREIRLLRGAAESYWNSRFLLEGRESHQSRFTYQRKGNKEAHLSDVVVQYDQQCNATKQALNPLVRHLLLHRIYPWIREAYNLSHPMRNNREQKMEQLYVYDSLLIRYNATEANAGMDHHLNNTDHDDHPLGHHRGVVVVGDVGAGQPLHRDLGYVSVNIMLNSHEEFEGGGTFFEDQLLPLLLSSSSSSSSEDDIIQCDDETRHHSMIQPLKPLGPGHALAHFSSRRHAGAATYAGVRDILVLFLAVSEKTNSGSHHAASNRGKRIPCWEINARLKANARAHCSECSTREERLICRVIHHRLAIEQVMDDGEAWHYCGMALLEYHEYLQSTTTTTTTRTTNNDNIIPTDVHNTNSRRAELLELAVACLYQATKHTPCDGRLYNNLGIALERLLRSRETAHGAAELELHERVSTAYETSIVIHSTCDKLRCNVGVDYASACLNYGLYLSKRDKFSKAIEVLSRIVPPNNDRLQADRHGRLIEDASNLLSFCKRQSLI